MPIENKGTFALTICYLSKPLPDNVIERLNCAHGGMLNDIKDEPEIAWVSGRHLLENEISEKTAILGGHLHVNLRRAERKVPASLLTAICRRDELAYMMAKETAVVPRQVRKEIREEAIEKNLMKMPPTVSAVTVAVDRAYNVLYAATTSQKSLDAIISAFVKDTEVEPYPMCINELMIRLFENEASELPNVVYGGSADTSALDMTPGRDFLTWLWYHSETNGGKIEVDEYGEFQLGIEGPLVFALASGDAKGAEESVVKKGCPQLAAEAKAALAVGKKLKRAKIVLARDQQVWSFTFDADKFVFSGVALPESEDLEQNALFEDRMLSIHIMQKAMEAYFKEFADTITGSRRAAFEKDARAWAKERAAM